MDSLETASPTILGINRLIHPSDTKKQKRYNPQKCGYLRLLAFGVAVGFIFKLKLDFLECMEYFCKEPKT